MPTQDNGFGAFWDAAFPGAIQAGPVVQAPTASYVSRGGMSGGQPLSPQEQAMSWYTQGYNGVRQSGADNQAAIDLLGRLAQDNTNRNQDALNGYYGVLDWQDQQNVLLNNQTQGLVNQLGSLTNDANSRDWGNYGAYAGAMNGIIGSNNGYMSGLGSALNQFSTPLQSGVSWQGDLTSQAASAQADASAIAAQQAAYNQLAGIGNGSLDVNNASLAGYQALAGVGSGSLDQSIYNNAGYNTLTRMMNGSADVNPWDDPGYNRLFEAAGGSLDYDINGDAAYKQLQGWANGQNRLDPMSIAGMQQLQGAANGSLDVKAGQSDPAAYAAALDAQAKYKALTSPEVTAAEKFIYEQQRLAEEQGQRANNAAMMSQLRQRGLSGAGATIANSALFNQQLSQNRLLGDLGAAAQAVNRSMDALAGYADVSTALNNSANQLSTANQSTRSSALQQLAGLASNIEDANKQRQYGAASAAADLSAQSGQANKSRQLAATTALTDAGLSTAQNNMNRRSNAANSAAGLYESNAQTNANRRAGAIGQQAGLDVSSAQANNDRRLSGTVASGNLASNMRQQSFDEAFKRGAAADQTAQFNRQSSIDVDKFNTLFAQDERNAAWNRQMDYTQTGLQTNRDNATNWNNVFTAGRTTNNDTFNRSAGVISAQDAANVQQNKLAQGQTDRRSQATGMQIGVNNTGLSNAQYPIGLGIQNNTQQALAWQDYTSGLAGLAGAQAQADQAKQAVKAAGRPGPLGLWTTYDDDAGKGSGLKFTW